MLECLAHAGIGRVARTHVSVEIAIAATVLPSIMARREGNLLINPRHLGGPARSFVFLALLAGVLRACRSATRA
jgi:hypothetical protein